MCVSGTSPPVSLRMDNFTYGYSVDRSAVGQQDLVRTRDFIRDTRRGDPSTVWSNSKTCWTYATKRLSSAATLTIGYGYTRRSTTITFRFNPDKLDAEGVGALRDNLQRCLVYGPTSLIAHGHIVKCELAADIPDVAFRDYYFVDSRLRVSNPHYIARGTAYFGARRGRTQVSCYDKASE